MDKRWRSWREEDKPVYPTDEAEQEKRLRDDPQLKDFRALRQSMKDDPLRPIYHFVRPDGYLNDPNGLCFWEGRWHLFYQACDEVIHWGHAVSEDLVFWRDLPFAIYPKYEDHCFSGGTCVDKENHRVIAAYYGYTGYDLETGYRCGTVLATSSDPLLLNWTKVNGGRPVIPDADAPCWTPPDTPPVKGQKPYQVFDSYIWKENGVYYLLEGGYTLHPKTKRRFRQVHLFRCMDDSLLNWEYQKPFLEHDRFREPGDDGACPYFMPIGDGKRLFMHFSHRCAPKYLIGDYDASSLEFFPFNGGRITSGYWTLVAPSAFPCPDGSVAVLFNMLEGRRHNGWSGVMTLPRRLTLGGVWGDELRQAPFADYSKLHGEHRRLTGIFLEKGKMQVLPEMQGNAFEMDITLRPEDIPPVLEIGILRSPDGEEVTRIAFFRQKGGGYAVLPCTNDSVIMLDTTHACKDPENTLLPEIAAVVMEKDEPLRVRVFADKSIVEVFVNDSQCVSQRAYPLRPDSVGISLLAQGGSAVVDNIDFWTMLPIFPNGEK